MYVWEKSKMSKDLDKKKTEIEIERLSRDWIFGKEFQFLQDEFTNLFKRYYMENETKSFEEAEKIFLRDSEKTRKLLKGMVK